MALNEYALNIKMSSNLYFKILRILRRNAESNYFNYLDQDMLLSELPAALRNEVLGITHKRILDSFNFFKGKPVKFAQDIIPQFKHISLTKDEVIYRKGELVDESNRFKCIYTYSLFFT